MSGIGVLGLNPYLLQHQKPQAATSWSKKRIPPLGAMLRQGEIVEPSEFL